MWRTCLSKATSWISRNPLRDYLTASVLVALAEFVRWLIALLGLEIVPFVTFYPATFFATTIGGAGPGAFAAMLGGILAWRVFPHRLAFMPLRMDEATSLLIYLIGSLLIVWGGDRYRALMKRFQDEERLRKLAVDELGHRLKNKIASIQAIISYQLRDQPELLAEISNRLVALASTDDLIMASQGRGASIRNILRTELAPYMLSRMSIEGPDFFLAPTYALTMSLVVHELATNAAKYGSLSRPGGKLSVTWMISNGKLNLEWRETNGPFVTAPTHRGFGLRLLPRALGQFDGSVETSFEPTGLVCKIEATLPDTVVPASNSNAA
jgi:two-component sensor histidine kinase